MRYAVLSVTVASAFLLSGCSVVGDLFSSDEPARDDGGSVTEAATNDVFALRVGDCFNSATLDEVVSEVPFIPCEESHDSEVYGRTELTGDEYPGEDAVAEQSDAFCYDEFQTFVGVSADNSELGYFPMYPLEEGWDDIGDREVLCVVYDLAGEVTGTLAGAAR